MCNEARAITATDELADELEKIMSAGEHSIGSLAKCIVVLVTTGITLMRSELNKDSDFSVHEGMDHIVLRVEAVLKVYFASRK